VPEPAALEVGELPLEREEREASSCGDRLGLLGGRGGLPWRPFIFLSSSPGRVDAVRVLIVEDEPKMAAVIRRGMRGVGIAADVADNGEDAIWMAGSVDYDAVVMDVMLPGLDGFEVCRRMRRERIWAPVLMLTARAAIEDRVAGLDGGADDYLTKPFSMAELLARLRALARRGPVEHPAILAAGELRMDPATREVWRGETEIQLSPTEFAMLETFLRRVGEVLTRDQLLEHVWDYDYENRSNIVESYVRFLRQKVDRPFDIESIETVRGAGYRLRRDGGSS